MTEAQTEARSVLADWLQDEGITPPIRHRPDPDGPEVPLPWPNCLRWMGTDPKLTGTLDNLWRDRPDGLARKLLDEAGLAPVHGPRMATRKEQATIELGMGADRFIGAMEEVRKTLSAFPAISTEAVEQMRDSVLAAIAQMNRGGSRAGKTRPRPHTRPRRRCGTCGGGGWSGGQPCPECASRGRR